MILIIYLLIYLQVELDILNQASMDINRLENELDVSKVVMVLR